ncbi:uncharacterized protein LOC122501492 [Leptopilina heterotoma]|uniref:uncharacterized protein LOC122501492 n=1 Tax=Leptopilina heterotoma TaxID=63436 RepID=UPI001CA8A02E|nr:uncharacterized protein LOC122501492 [Leptopilina heterotoma]XP_043466935.1 uncharacterized protein LOC122501492 [Leptopilina heterotoma]
MIKIAFICLLLTIVNSEGQELNNNNLEKIRISLSEAKKIMKDQLVKEDAAILFSNPKAGKSTLVNYLIGSKLKGTKSPLSEEEIIVVKSNNQSKGPEIGIGSLSKTTIPTKWKSTILPNLALWDTPAFFDNRGLVQDVTNAYYLYKLLKSVKSLKIILVVDIQDLNRGNVQMFLSLLNAIEALFGNNFKSFFPSVSVIFSKVPETIDEIPVDFKYISNKLENVFLHPKLKSFKNSKNFIQYIIDNNDRIALFKKMSKETKVSSDIDVNILSVIKNSKIIDESSLKDTHPHISDSSMIMLYEATEELLPISKMDQIENIASQALLEDRNNIENLIDEENSNKIKSIKDELTNKKNSFSHSLIGENDIYRKMPILLSFHDDLKKLNEEDKILDKIELINYIETILNIIISKDLNFSFDTIIVSLYLKLKTAISVCETGLMILSPDDLISDVESSENVLGMDYEPVGDESLLTYSTIDPFYDSLPTEPTFDIERWNSFLDIVTNMTKTDIKKNIFKTFFKITNTLLNKKLSESFN